MIRDLGALAVEASVLPLLLAAVVGFACFWLGWFSHWTRDERKRAKVRRATEEATAGQVSRLVPGQRVRWPK